MWRACVPGCVPRPGWTRLARARDANAGNSIRQHRPDSNGRPRPTQYLKSSILQVRRGDGVAAQMHRPAAREDGDGADPLTAAAAALNLHYTESAKIKEMYTRTGR